MVRFRNLFSGPIIFDNFMCPLGRKEICVNPSSLLVSVYVTGKTERKEDVSSLPVKPEFSTNPSMYLF